MEEIGNRYKDLIVWQKSMVLVKKVYEITKSYPKEELYALTSQTKKSAISIPSNIAEGKGRGSNKDFIRFLYMALGSLYELQTQIEIAEKLGFIKDPKDFFQLSLQIEKMLNRLISSKKEIYE